MKLLVLFSLFAGQVFAQNQAPRFSAFAVNDSLIVTILGDTCNAHRGRLQVAENCKQDRPIKNLAFTCRVNLRVSTTRKMCQKPGFIPRVITLKLSEQNVAKEARSLILNYQNTNLRVNIAR
jgi:hypothetical protein